jgi:hypothetical protein
MKEFYHGDTEARKRQEDKKGFGEQPTGIAKPRALRAESFFQYIASYLVTTQSPPLCSTVTVKRS